MSGFGNNSVTGIGTTSEARVASALIPREIKATATNDSNGAAGSQSTSPSTNTITSSDFLTLLVSELKNQDPTQPTDPNAYISQLVGVNSLQQLIQINQGLTTIEPSTTSTTTSAS
jgi:flagellar basal-body rod modification protein FlgD